MPALYPSAIHVGLWPKQSYGVGLTAVELIPMTPAAVTIVSELRGRFYSHFAAAMPPTVTVVNAKQGATGASVAVWVDQHQQLNYLYIYARVAPDPFLPQRPLILRISINRGTELPFLSRRKWGSRALNQDWCFDLTLLPEEVLAFVPWVVGVIQSQAGDTDAAMDSPYPLTFSLSRPRSFLNAWTLGAWNCLRAAGLDQWALAITESPTPSV